jgi:anti-sigma regulatory factor (Ser/Thr protein kinase)
VQKPRLELVVPLPEDWEAVDLVRASVLTWLRVCFPGSDAVEPLAMVVAELLENAVKFGDWKDPARRSLELSVRSNGERMEVVVSSPTALDDPNLRALVAELDRIERAPSSQEAYLERVRRLALAGAGGLGLARIAHEGGCLLSAEVTAERVLRVKAVTREPVRPTPAAP